MLGRSCASLRAPATPGKGRSGAHSVDKRTIKYTYPVASTSIHVADPTSHLVAPWQYRRHRTRVAPWQDNLNVHRTACQPEQPMTWAGIMLIRPAASQTSVNDQHPQPVCSTSHSSVRPASSTTIANQPARPADVMTFCCDGTASRPIYAWQHRSTPLASSRSRHK